MPRLTSRLGLDAAVMNAVEEAGYPDDLEIDLDYLDYSQFDPATAHLFEIRSNLLI